MSQTATANKEVSETLRELRVAVRNAKYLILELKNAVEDGEDPSSLPRSRRTNPELSSDSNE